MEAIVFSLYDEGDLSRNCSFAQSNSFARKGERRSLDDIGERGQWIFALIMTELCGRDEPFFRPRFLGDKHPTFDYLVELVDVPQYFFFVQVKATTQGYTQRAPIRLKVQVSQADVDRMVACPAPTYVVGIDLPGQDAFLLSINEPRGRVSSLTTAHRIGCATLETLAAEVRDYCASKPMTLAGSHFSE
jgi:hypothetical protein